MSREDIIRSAREAFGVEIIYDNDIPRIERFAALVAAAEREACLALHDHEDVLAPVGASSWGEAYQEGWAKGTAAYHAAIRARGEA